MNFGFEIELRARLLSGNKGRLNFYETSGMSLAAVSF
jgi:hypothetical protein